MKGFRLLEVATTKYFLWLVVAATTATLGSFALLLYRYVNLEQLSQGADIAFKTMAVLVGSIWALNRYYISRADAPQLRVDANLDLVEGHEFMPRTENDLLLYRLDIVNTGKTLIQSFEQAIAFESVRPIGSEVEHDLIYRWPAQGMHPCGAIEPGSWSAVNSAFPVSRAVVAVRVFVDLALEGEGRWTWHRTFRIRKAPTLEKHVSKEDMPCAG